jgi:putative ABC transport system permease protein
MWIVAFRDLEARRRRVAIGVVATALVFAITLLLAGVSAAMKNEIRRTVGSLRVDAWVLPKGVTGPFTSWRTLAAARASDVAREPGVTAAAPVVLFRQTTRTPAIKDVNVIGYEPGSLGGPPIASGRSLAHDGEIIVDRKLGKHIGEVVTLTGKPFHVVGITHGLTYFAGIPATFVTLHDAQRLVYEGAPFATAIVTRGVPKQLPADLTAVDNAHVRSDLARPVRQAASTIGFLNILLWIIAAGIIGAILYMSALERIRDFAVMKATGASNRFVTSVLGTQAVVLAVASAVIALVVSLALQPLVPMSVEVPASAYALLFVVAIVVGLVASIAGLRRAVSVDPALAFGG